MAVDFGDEVGGDAAGRMGSLRGLLLNLGFCLLVAGGLFLSFGVPLGHAVVVSCCIGFSIQGLSTLGAWLARGRVLLMLIMVVTVPAGVLLGYALGEVLLTGGWSQAWALQQESLLLGALFGVLGAGLFLLGTSVFSLRDSLRDARVQQLAAAKALAEAELRRLQAQIEPHFLFNTLANVRSLMRRDPAAAEQALEQLSDLFRASLQRSRNAHSTLSDELEVLERYLSLQALRMGDRLQWQLDVAPELASRVLPPLLLQPLVENALHHGIEPVAEGGRVVVRASRRGAHGMLIEVIDDGAGLAADHALSDGIGLANIRERLQALYGDDAWLEMVPAAGGGTCARLAVPATGSEA